MNDFPCSECGDLDGCHMPAKIRDNRLDLSEFWDAHSEWSQVTFGTDKERGPIGPLKHMLKELQNELLPLYTTNQDVELSDIDAIEEFADILFLLFDACRRAGYQFEDLRLAVNLKLKKNSQRKWQKGGVNDAIEHIREEIE